MANVNVKKRLAAIDSELKTISVYVHQHSGVSKEDASAVETLTDGILQTTAMIGQVARERIGYREPKGSFVKRIRKAIGFTTP